MVNTENYDTISVNQQNINGDNNSVIKKEVNLSKHDNGKSMPTKKEGVNYFKILMVVLVGTIVFWALSLLSYFTFGFVISETNIILTFVGVLTAFILISNYAQVKEIKDDFNREKQELCWRIEALEKETSKLSAKVDIARLKGELYSASNDYREYVNNCLSKKREQ